MGIEPTSKAWEAFILPMNYARKNSAELSIAWVCPFGKRNFGGRGSRLSDVLRDGFVRKTPHRTESVRQQLTVIPITQFAAYRLCRAAHISHCFNHTNKMGKFSKYNWRMIYYLV